MTEIRRVNADELEACYKLDTIVYNETRDFSKEKVPEEWYLDYYKDWGAFENGKLLSTMVEIDYLMRFDNNNVKMSGIGGVGTLPEARQKGYVQMIFEKLLPQAYERGVLFSNLTPFSHAYYRKFGYELACARNEITIPLRDFALPMRGTFTPVLPGDDTSELALVHAAYIAPLNHGISRAYWADNKAWQLFTKEDPFTSGTFIYLWRNNEGEAKSYIKYKHEKSGEDNIMRVKELAFVDREGLYGALSLLSGLASQYNVFKWAMPTFLDPADFILDMWTVDQRIIPRDMTRIVNVSSALSLLRRPEGSGSYTLEVFDKQISANNGRFRVVYDNSGVQVSRTRAAPDLVCTVAALAQLVMGYRTLGNALLTKQSDLEVLANRDLLDRVWTLRPQHLTEEF